MGWIVAIVVLLSGCGPPQAEDVLYDYSERVHNALELDAPSDYQHSLPTYPRRRDLRLEQSDLRIGLLDLVSLDRCGLEKLVAERNSALGKVMPASQQLFTNIACSVWPAPAQTRYALVQIPTSIY